MYQIVTKYLTNIGTLSTARAGDGEPRAEHPPCRPGRGERPADNP